MTIRSLLPSLSTLIAGALFATSAIAAQPIGRLFLTPQERQALDNLRERGVVEGSDKVALAPEPISTAQHLTVNGIVRRSDGQSAVWLNQLQQSGSGIAVLSSRNQTGAVRLRLPSGKSVAMKAGQTFDMEQGIIREGYEGATGPIPQVTR